MKQHGFTLIELLVVLVIISIITAVAVLSFGDFGAKRRIHNTAQKIALKISFAQKLAILEPAILGLKITKDGYGFYKFSDKWHALSKDNVLKFKKISSKITIVLKAHNKILKDDSNINIIFLPSGDMTPFKLFIGPKEELPLYTITGKANGTIKISS